MTKARLILRFILIVSFLTVIILTAGMSSYMSLSFGRQAVAELTGQVKEVEIAKTVKDQPRGKTVLVLHTLKAKRPWNVLFNRYFTEALQENNLTLANLEIENLDLLQFKDANYQGIVKRQLEHKYANSPPDIIIITFASTIKFILENDLFSDIPKIFVLPTPSGLDDVPHSVVLPFAFEFKNNIEHALTLLPDTKSIYVVAGNGLMDRRLVSMFRDETKDFRDRVSFHYLDDLNVEELLNRLEHLPDDSFVYYLTYSLDFQGKAVITRDFSKSIGKRSNRPVFSWLDLHALDIGILGGRVTTTRASATMSLDIVKRVFQGESVDTIKPEPPYVEYIYQWRELKKWNIGLRKLPPDSIIQNRPVNFFEIFKWQIVAVICLLVVESLLVFFLLINIRKRKTAYKQIHEMASFAELNPAPVLRVDPDGIIVSCNPASVDILGKNVQKGTPLSFVVPDLSGIDLNECIHGNMLLSKEVEIEGRFYLFILRGVSDLKLLHIYGSDITENKKQEEEAQRQREIMARVGRTTRMGQLTGSIAHEINQPLTGILSNAQAGEFMIKKGRYDEEELVEIMADIAADAKRAGEVIRNLRELYRNQKGKRQPVNINDIVNDTIKLIHSELVIQHVELTTECTSSIPMVNGNRIQIQQVLMNLIMNGNQAMSDMSREARRLHVTTANEANEVVVLVEDCGPGVDPDKIDSIFEPLATWKSGGTGMGLAISNSIIEAHGGKMLAENMPEGGARIGFVLPLLKEGKLV
jgi:signal transduction histidine kinase